MPLPRVFIDINSNSCSGRLIIELYSDKTPITCENFRSLCAGEKLSPNGKRLCYLGSIFDRVVAPEFILQGGKIVTDDDADYIPLVGETIYHKPIELENPGWRDINEAGLVCMAHPENDSNMNGSEFFITLQPDLNISNEYPCTVFGHVVKGFEILEQLENVVVDENDKPITEDQIIISRCGELEFRPKKKRKPSSQTTLEETPFNPNTSTENNQDQDANIENKNIHKVKEQQIQKSSVPSLEKSKSLNFEDTKTARNKIVKEEPVARKRSVDKSRYENFNDRIPSRGFYERDYRSHRPYSRNNHEDDGRSRRHETKHSNESGVIVKGRGSAKFRSEY